LKQIGEVEGNCRVLQDLVAEYCTLSYVFPNLGTVEAQGVYYGDDGADGRVDSFPVIGGTGAFANKIGQLVQTRVKSPLNGWEIKISLKN